MAGRRAGFRRCLSACWFPGVLLIALLPGRGTAAPQAETRDFAVYVDGNPAGDVHMTINKQDGDSVQVSCDTDIKVVFRVGLVTKQYLYSYRGQESWKKGRLVRFDSTCSDDGKRFAVSAVAAGERLQVRVNNEEKTMPGDTGLTSYWSMPEDAKLDKTVPILDADNGTELAMKVQFLGIEERTVTGQKRKVNHFRLTGKTSIELWYDTASRLVAQEWIEDGHRTQVELTRLRR